MIFYRATGGGTDWTGDNWGSDEPIGTWQGVTTNADGRVTRLLLGGDGLTGSIPSELGQLTNLQWLTLVNDELSGSIPSELGQPDQPGTVVFVRQRVKRFDSLFVR